MLTGKLDSLEVRVFKTLELVLGESGFILLKIIKETPSVKGGRSLGQVAFCQRSLQRSTEVSFRAHKSSGSPLEFLFHPNQSCFCFCSNANKMDQKGSLN